MKEIENHKCFGGTLSIWEHQSIALKCLMRFSIFLPPNAEEEKTPFITFLSGLTCTHENFTTKAGAFKSAAEHGLAIVAPDTSPRGDDVPDDKNSYDFGQGAGFYINATQQPWAKNYQMESYIIDELNNLITNKFPLNSEKQGICGHSMGGHGALTLYLKHPQKFKSVSAFSPIVAPSQVPWGQKAFKGYLGDNKKEWEEHDASALMLKTENAKDNPEILIDQGLDDQFLNVQLKPEIFDVACKKADQKLNFRLHAGYDHSYYFIQSFIDDHISHHMNIL